MRRVFRNCLTAVFVCAVALESSGFALQREIDPELEMPRQIPEWLFLVARWIRIMGDTISVPIG